MGSIFVVTYNHATGEFQVDDSLADANFLMEFGIKKEGFTRLERRGKSNGCCGGTLQSHLFKSRIKSSLDLQEHSLFGI